MADELELIIQPEIETSIEDVASKMVENMRNTFFNFELSINKNIKNSINEVSNSIKEKSENIKQTINEATTGINQGWKNSNNLLKKSFNTNFRKIRIDLKKSIKQMKNDMKDLKPPNQLTEGYKSLRNVIVGAFAVSSLKNFASASIELYKTQNLVETKLKANMQTVKAYGGNTEAMAKAFERLKDKASAIQEIGVIGDEVLLAGAAQLSTFQLSEKSISRLLPGMADMLVNMKGLEASTGDAFQLANQLGKSISMGTLANLREVGFTVDENTEKMFKLSNGAERIALIEKVIAENAGKANEAMAKSPEGQIQQVSNAWGDMKEEIGRALIPTILEFTKILKDNLPEIQNILIKIASTISNVAIEIIKNINSVKNIFKKLDDVIGIKNILTFVGAFMAISKVVPIIISIIKTVMFLKNAISAVITIITANPIALVVAGIGVALYQLWKNWDTVKEFFIKSFDTIKNKFEGIWEGMKNVFKNFVIGYISIYQNMINAIIKGVNAIGKKIPKFKEIKEVDFTTGVKKMLNVEKAETVTKEEVNKVNINNKQDFNFSFTGNVSNQYKDNITKFIKEENERELRRQEIEMGLI